MSIVLLLIPICLIVLMISIDKSKRPAYLDQLQQLNEVALKYKKC